MLFIVILAEVLVVAGMAVAVLRDEKKLKNDFNNWLGTPHKPVYKIPLTIIVREEIKAQVSKHNDRAPRKVAKVTTARHKYVHP